uniref:Uncharacterized protein n=1 Tax=Wuchereria bancrofti TaxID=6293 RepID=A0AAF5RTJ8_WUCBA
MLKYNSLLINRAGKKGKMEEK